MIELLLSQIIKSSISIAKEILRTRIIETNNELLSRKKKLLKEKERYKVTPEQIKEVVLKPAETIRAELIFFEQKALDNLKSHIAEVKRWSEKISFMDLRGSKSLHNMYVELDTYLMPLRTHFDDCARYSVKPLQTAVFGSKRHSIVLGQPGSGKTTSMKKLCTLFFDNTEFKKYNFPIVVNLRDLKDEDGDISIQKQINQIFEFEISTNQTTKKVLNENSNNEWINDLEELIEKKIFVTILNNLKALIILEGFDEIPTSRQKEFALKEIRYLAKKLQNSKIIITCRTGEFNYDIDECETFEISALSEDQISLFVNKWIDDKKRVSKFLEDMKKSPFWGTAIKPLSLAHLCAIYERIGSIPDRPKTVYRKVVGLLIEEWDEQRSINRPSNYSNFEPDRKFEFLTHLSFCLTMIGRTTVFSKSQLVQAYLKICGNFGLPKSQSAKVANEIESHTGLFVQTGFEKYEFAHKSLQEYLTAEYIVKLPSLEVIDDCVDLLGAGLRRLYPPTQVYTFLNLCCGYLLKSRKVHLFTMPL